MGFLPNGELGHIGCDQVASIAMRETKKQLLERAFLLAEIAQRALERASNAESQQERRLEFLSFQDACIQLVEKMNSVELDDARVALVRPRQGAVKAVAEERV
ncbi:hypothetical protein [uncultured Shimia sp.]|uniref:hypothetical protein n=1 Tax=uncultured Shimia sp. TaxID=573152 RepID=UPI002609124C|nr:hypothetical protein [uncultured Shimia sp.]